MNSTRLAASGAALLVIAGIGFTAAPANAIDATFPPVAVADYYTIVQDTDLVVGPEIGLLANDLDGGNSGLMVGSVDVIPEGTLTWGADGHFRFIPTPGFVGTAHFVYYDIAGGFQSNGADIYIEVTAAPTIKLVGSPDFYTTPKDTVLDTQGITDVVLNDVSVGYVGGIDDATGEVNMDIYGRFVYTPAPGFVGTKTFSYFLDDHTATPSDWILVTIEVTDPSVTIIPSIPLDPGTPIDSTVPSSDLPTLAYTGAGDVSEWLLAPGLALLALGGFAMWFARRRAAL